MPTTRPRVPGWHPDPNDPAQLRHWNGKRWGSERRPRPSWAAQPRSAGLVSAAGPQGEGPRPPAGGSKRKWYLLAGGALLFAFLVISVPAWLAPGDIPARTVSDAAYTSRADALCKAALPKLRVDRPESREDNGTPAQFAARIDRAADGLATVAGDLRAIPTATAADGAEIDGWLDDWNAYIALGRQFADTIEAGKPKRGQEISADSQTLAQRIFGFSKGNDMPSCVF